MTKNTRGRRQKNGVPRHLLQNLAQDIISMVENDEGYPLALEVIDQLPEDLQAMLIENLSSVHEAPLARFFWLVAEEYEGEVKKSAQRALEKYRLAGLSLDEWRINQPQYPDQLFMALASRTRLQGQVTLVMAWRQADTKLDVRYFVLKYGDEGIFRYFRVNDLSEEGFLAENNLRKGELLQVSYAEACYLLQEAFRHNLSGGKHAARPIFQYRRWLEEEVQLTNDEIERLTYRLKLGKTSPAQVVNAYLLAENNNDWGLLYDLSPVRSTVRRQGRADYISGHLAGDTPGKGYLHTSIISESIKRKTAEVRVYTVRESEDKLFKSESAFTLYREESEWKVARVKQISNQEMGENDPGNPLNYEVYCSLYDVQDSAEVQAFLAEMPEVDLFGEFPAGLHYRWGQHPNPLVEGINVSSSIFGEFVLAEGELLVIAQDRNNLDAICSLLENRLADNSVTYRQQYYLDVGLAYAVLSGEFTSFEELLTELAVEEPEEKLPLVVATYEVSHLAPVLRRIRTFTVFEFDMPEGIKIFYEFEQIRSGANGAEAGEGFVAEYRVTPSFLTVATFGREYLTLICQELERGLKQELNLVDVEEQEEGYSLLAAISRPNIPRDTFVRWQQKELSRWMETEIPALGGLTPQQAKSSLKGRQLLWGLFKHMKNVQKDLQSKGLNNPIDYREYIRAVGMGEDYNPDS
ncbi:MAG: hypothetical protein HPY50_04390 [Firmicutes bacterium]|nr:hypothetical protein [Bacillota bacterium]